VIGDNPLFRKVNLASHSTASPKTLTAIVFFSGSEVSTPSYIWQCKNKNIEKFLSDKYSNVSKRCEKIAEADM